jgi:hypothetical protein
VSDQEAEFSSLVLDPQSWLRQSEQFYLAAQVLVPKLKLQRPITQDSNTLAVGSLKAVLLLLAISLENALKAVKAMRKEIFVTNGKIDAEKSFGKKGGHNLLGLAKSIDLSFNAREEELLEQLTEVIIWAGRYQQPMTIEAFGRAKKKSPRNLAVPQDIEMVDSILNKIREIIHARAEFF